MSRSPLVSSTAEPDNGSRSGVSCWETPFAVGLEHSTQFSPVTMPSPSSAEATVGQLVGVTPLPPDWTVTSTHPVDVAS